MARDSFSYLHLPMVAGIVLVALGIKKTLAHVDDPLHVVPATALLGGTALYLLAHVAFRWRNVHTLNRRRLGLAIVLLALIPVAVRRPCDRDARAAGGRAGRADRLRDDDASPSCATACGIRNRPDARQYARPNGAVHSATA